MTDFSEFWFIQVEAQFENKRITASRTKLTHCVAALPQNVACRLLDLVRSPPNDPYEALCQWLIKSLPSFRPASLRADANARLPKDKKPGYFLDLNCSLSR